MLSVGVLTAYRQMQTAVSQESKLTLANVEAFALDDDMEKDLGAKCEARALCSNGAEILCEGKYFCASTIGNEGQRQVSCDWQLLGECL